MTQTTQTHHQAHHQELTQESRISDFFQLLKPKVMSLVVFTGFAGMLAAPGFSALHPFLALMVMFSLALGAGAAGAINMWYDRDIDAIMNRTKTRPIPTGYIAPAEALSFGLIMSLASVILMGLASNWTAAALLGFANAFYIFIYTIWLKRRTPQNIVIGGAAGAFPPMIGWAAVTGDITLYPIILFAIIFFWTPPHFWALSLFANEDYKRANIPMLSVTNGPRTTKIQMMAYTLILIPITLLPFFFGFTGMPYGVVTALLGAAFILSNIRVLMNEDLKHAKIMFGYSVFYLFALFLMVIIDAA